MGCPDDNLLAEFAQGLLDPTTRERVASHLDRCAVCPALVAEAGQPTVGAPTDDSAAPQPRPVHLRRGTPVGKYVIAEPIGRGGLSDVYSAYDPALDRHVAIKFLRRFGDEFDRFARREGRALARLSHPNIVQVFEVGVFAGRIYTAMELVRGTTLRAWLAHSKRSWKEVREVFIRAGGALAAAHAQGVIHCDFKPDNVMVTQDGHVKVLDFGLASTTPPPNGARGQGQPAQPSLAGTPAYMAPEIYCGSPFDARADQFGFCVALFEALCGRLPFPQTDPAELRAAVIAGRVCPTPSTVRLPQWLERSVRRGLSPNPDGRYGLMTDLLAALQRDKRSRSRGWTAALMSVVVGAAVVGVTLPDAEVVAPAEQHLAVSELVVAAAEAAARGHYIYPPMDEPDGNTVYRSLVELEAVPAQEQARELRRQSAAELVKLGDTYWESASSAPFAADFYTAALVFEPDNQHARQRAIVTRGELAALRQQAAGLSFSEGERCAGEALAALAEPTSKGRVARLKRLHRRPNAVPNSTTQRLESIVGERLDDSSARLARADPPGAAPEQRPRPRDSQVDARVAARVSSQPAHDRRGAVQEVRRGRAALRQGELSAAEKHFMRALSGHPGHRGALGGLSDVNFERRDYAKSLQFAQRCVRTHPRHAECHLRVGDANYRMLRYRAALSSYAAAEALGHKEAKHRADALRTKLGT